VTAQAEVDASPASPPTAGEALDAIMRDLDAATDAWVAAGYRDDTPEHLAREAVFARLRAWNEQQANPKDSPAVGTPAPGEGGDVAAGSSPRVTAAAGPGERGTSAAAEGSPDLSQADDGVADAMSFLAAGEELLALAGRLNRLHEVQAEQRSTAKRWADVAAAARTLADAVHPSALSRRVAVPDALGADDHVTTDLLPAELGEQFETAKRALAVLSALGDAASAAATREAEWTGEAIADFPFDESAVCGNETVSFDGIGCELTAGHDGQHRSGAYSWGEVSRG
jgi:hypothetical protein